MVSFSNKDINSLINCTTFIFYFKEKTSVITEINILKNIPEVYLQFEITCIYIS